MAKRQVSPEAARALIESYRTNGSGDPQHPVSSGEDGPEVITIVSTGHLTKTIGGTQNRTLFRDAGTLANTYAWIRGDPTHENVRANIWFPSATGSISFDNDFAPKPGMTSLMSAASIGDLAQVERELAAGAKINAQDSSGFTALIYASWSGDTKVIRRLIKAGADVKLRSNLGQTAIMAAVAGLRPSEENSGILISSGADVNVQDHDGNSALMLAAPQSPPALVFFLLARGARKDLRDSNGHTATGIVAAQLGKTENRRAILRKLSPGGANTNGFDAGLDSRVQLLQQVRDILTGP